MSTSSKPRDKSCLPKTHLLTKACLPKPVLSLSLLVPRFVPGSLIWVYNYVLWRLLLVQTITKKLGKQTFERKINFLKFSICFVPHPYTKRFPEGIESIWAYWVLLIYYAKIMDISRIYFIEYTQTLLLSIKHSIQGFGFFCVKSIIGSWYNFLLCYLIFKQILLRTPH